MGHKTLIHFFRCLLWFSLLHFRAKASPCPKTEPDACKDHQSSLGVAAAAAAQETPQGERGCTSTVAELTCCPAENEHTCNVAELAQLPCRNLMVNQAEGVSDRLLDTGIGRNSYPNSAMASEQVLFQALDQQGSATEGLGLPFQHAMMEENEFFSLLSLPKEITANQPEQVQDGGTDAGLEFGANLRKDSRRPESGTPSLQHNTIPFTETLQSSVDRTTKCAVDDSLEFQGLGLVHKDATSVAFKAPAGGRVEESAARDHGDGGGTFQTIDPSYLKNVLVKNSARPGSGGSSKKHN